MIHFLYLNISLLSAETDQQKNTFSRLNVNVFLLILKTSHYR